MNNVPSTIFKILLLSERYQQDCQAELAASGMKPANSSPLKGFKVPGKPAVEYTMNIHYCSKTKPFCKTEPKTKILSLLLVPGKQ